jgi:hypothetical protein
MTDTRAVPPPERREELLDSEPWFRNLLAARELVADLASRRTRHHLLAGIDEAIRRLRASSPAAHAERPDVIAAAVRLAMEATNGWACYAKRKIELDEIGRLHRELKALRAGRSQDLP